MDKATAMPAGRRESVVLKQAMQEIALAKFKRETVFP
jgi:hypothetical protein